MKISKKQLELIGAALYICEGTKLRIDNRGWKQYALEFTNNNPSIIKIYLRFLREVINVDESRLKIQIFCYPDHDKNETEVFWSKLTGISLSNFNKTICLRRRKDNFNYSSYGTVKIRYHKKEDFLKVYNIIDRIFV